MSIFLRLREAGLDASPLAREAQVRAVVVFDTTRQELSRALEGISGYRIAEVESL